MDEARRITTSPRLAIARRLKCARILRGFSSAIAASKSLGIRTPTYLKHENGSNGIGEGLLESYAHDFRVSYDWLLLGKLPSGLGKEIDRNIHKIIDDPMQYLGAAAAQLAATYHGPPTHLETGRRKGTIPVPEYLWSSLIEGRGDLTKLKPKSTIQFPRVADWEDEFFSVLVDVADPKYAKYRRVFVTKSFSDVGEDTDYLVSSGKKLEIVKIPNRAAARLPNVVGRLIGTIAKFG
ncbi:hypothetical protein XI06_20185 [Bradyrhizobium sp. CCBAU 11434]|nr:hypothetical protein [Bradyrhizobium sp. CCBAU 11434]